MKACTADQMREIDRVSIEEHGIPSLLLMENAGRAVARRALLLLRRLGSKGPVTVLCGTGNNGGDGLVAARTLRNLGWPVVVRLHCPPDRLRPDPRACHDLLAALPGVRFEQGDAADPPPLSSDLVVDALLGTGFRGAPTGPVAASIRQCRDHPAVLSVDIPSGLDADTGVAGGECVRALETVTFGLPKVGLLTGPHHHFAGRVTVAEIGFPFPLLQSDAIRCEWIRKEEARALWPPRAPDSHKGTSGRLLILAGSVGMTGAAALCASGAVRAGAGLVVVGCPEPAQPVVAALLLEAMSVGLPATDAGTLSAAALDAVRSRLARADALAVGPGLGRHPGTDALLAALLPGCPVPVVVDADGLNWLAENPVRLPPTAVLTPHPGEMARLLGTEPAEVESNRLGAARTAADRFGCCVLLKGPGTVVVEPGGEAAIVGAGGPALATGGAGDVLTGVIGAALARGLSPFQAAVGGAFVHGLAGEIAGRELGAPGAAAGDVAARIPDALGELVGRPGKRIAGRKGRTGRLSES